MKKAFTLAEVLITLGIIGTVAALTLPSVIQNYQKKQTVIRLKAIYSILDQAYLTSVQENGEVEDWDWENLTVNGTAFADKYILPYLKGVHKGPWYTVYTLSGKREYYFQYYTHSLPNGMLLQFGGLNAVNNSNIWNRPKTHLMIFVDINGKRKPNKLGRDVFVFSIFPFVKEKAHILPGSNDQCGSGQWHYRLTREQLLTTGCATCKPDSVGYGCSTVIMRDGWQIKSDYPW